MSITPMFMFVIHKMHKRCHTHFIEIRKGIKELNFREYSLSSSTPLHNTLYIVRNLKELIFATFLGRTQLKQHLRILFS